MAMLESIKLFCSDSFIRKGLNLLLFNSVSSSDGFAKKFIQPSIFNLFCCLFVLFFP